MTTCCNHDCDEGRTCPQRATPIRTRNGGEQVNTLHASDPGLPAVMFTEPYAWMAESIQRAKELAIATFVVAFVAFGVLVWLAR